MARTIIGVNDAKAIKKWSGMLALAGPLGKKIMLGGVMLGAVNAMLAMAVMGGGDDGDDAWEKIPEFVKEKNLIIPISRTEYFSLPLPLGFHFLPNIGRLAVEMMVGGRDHSPASQLGKLLQVLLDAFNPLGGTQSVSQLVTPVIEPPVVEPPVIEPPVVVDPPVIENPVIEPPVVEPPVVEPPVVELLCHW